MSHQLINFNIPTGLKDTLDEIAKAKRLSRTAIINPAYSPNARFQSARERVGDGFDLFRGFGTASSDGSGVIQAADG